MKNVNYKLYSFITGVVFLLLLLAVFVLIPCPTGPQLNFFRIFIAIAAGAFSAALTGSLKFNNKLVMATGSIGVFVLVYLINPAGWNTGACGSQNFKAVVYVDGQPKKNVVVTIPALGRQSVTDEFGFVTIEYSLDMLSFPATVLFKYSGLLDTTVTLPAPPEGKLEFRFTSGAITSSFSVSGHSVSYQQNDVGINISLLSCNEMDPMLSPDSVEYKFTASNDTIFIIPTSPFLDQRRNGEVIKGYFNDDFATSLPRLDLKLTNNTEDAIFLNELLVNVNESTENNEPVVLPHVFGGILFKNIGWGVAKDFHINFNVARTTEFQGWKDASYQHHKVIPVLASNSSAGVERRDVLDIIGVSEMDAEMSIYPAYSEGLSEEAIRISKERTKGYDAGLTAYGTYSYTDNNGKRQEFKFVSEFDIHGGYGDGGDLTGMYNTEFKTTGENYLLSVPVSQAIKPKNFDRFGLTMLSKRSSKHFFRISLMYDGKKIELPNVFCLNYFNMPDKFQAYRKAKSIREAS